MSAPSRYNNLEILGLHIAMLEVRCHGVDFRLRYFFFDLELRIIKEGNQGLEGGSEKVETLQVETGLHCAEDRFAQEGAEDKDEQDEHDDPLQWVRALHSLRHE